MALTKSKAFVCVAVGFAQYSPQRFQRILTLTEILDTVRYTVIINLE